MGILWDKVARIEVNQTKWILFLRARNFGLGGDNGDFDYTQLQMIANAKAA